MVGEMLFLKCSKCDKDYENPEDFYHGTSNWTISDKGVLWFMCSCGESMALKEGEFSWYDPSRQFDDPKLGSLFTELNRTKAAPRIPQIALLAKQELSKENFNLEKVAKLIKQDPLLAANILEVANIHKRTEEAEIKNIHHALSYLGRKSIVNLLTVAAMRKFQIKTKMFSVEKFWDHSILSGVVAELMVEMFSIDCNKDEVYLAASLANIGKLVMAWYFADDIDLVENLVQNAQDVPRWVDIESSLKIIASHTTLGEIACVMWGLPSSVKLVCGKHHDLAKAQNMVAPQGAINAFEVACLAPQFAHWIQNNFNEVDKVMIEYFKKKLSVDNGHVMTFMTKLAKAIDSRKRKDPDLKVS